MQKVNVIAAASGLVFTDVIRARVGDSNFTPTPPNTFLYMPAGTHTITPFLKGEPFDITVKVGPEAAAALNLTLAAHNATGRKPFFCFDHEEKAASFWPEEFTWTDAGVMVRGQWSQAGLEAIQGRTHRNFSPAFTTNKLHTTAAAPAIIKSAPLAMGSLVNNQAFDKLPPLWAKNSGGQSAINQKNKTENTMNEQELAALKANQAALLTELNTLKAKSAGEQNAEIIRATQASHDAVKAQVAAEETLKTANAKVVSLEAEKAKFETAEAARRKELAATVIQAAQARGVFPLQPAADSDDAKKIARWEGLIVADPANAPLLARMGGKPELTQVITPGARSRIEVVENADVILAAYGKERSAADRGRFYMREISPRLARGEDFNIRAANSLGTLVGNIISQRALELLQELYPWLRSVTTDFTAEAVSFNQSVLTRALTVPTATNYDTTNGYTDSDATLTDVTVTIDKHKAVQVSFTANDMAGTNRRLIEEQAAAMQYAIGKTLADAVGALVLNANFTNKTTVANANFARSSVVDVVVGLNNRKAPQMQRSVVINPTLYGALLKDTGIVNVALIESWQAATGGRAPNIAGAQIFQWIDLPNNSENLTGFGCSPDALVIAARLPNDYAANSNTPATAAMEVVTNPATGLSVQLTRFVDHKAGKAYGRAAWMFGAAKGQATSLQRIIWA